MVVASRYFAFRALITQRTGIDFVSCLHNCREFSQTSLVFMSGYANTENVFYCIIIWLCGGTLCGYFCWSGWPRAYSELNPTPHLTPKYLLPTQWVSSPSPTYSLPLRPVRVPVQTAPWHTNYAICDAQLRHRNRATTTFNVCKRKPYPTWFLYWRMRKSYPVWCEHLSDMFLHFKRLARRSIRAVMRNFAETEAPGADLEGGCRGCAPPVR